IEFNCSQERCNTITALVFIGREKKKKGKLFSIIN
ncbi:hypothetical protein, partial [Plasmodium yoelii yoelii]